MRVSDFGAPSPRARQVRGTPLPDYAFPSHPGRRRASLGEGEAPSEIAKVAIADVALNTREALAVKRAQRVQLGRRPGVSSAVVGGSPAAGHGRTLAWIAARLNADEVPTAQGGVQWYPATFAAGLAPHFLDLPLTGIGTAAVPGVPLPRPRIWSIARDPVTGGRKPPPAVASSCARGDAV